MMRMIRSLDLARRSKASFKTHAALVESLAQSDETLVVTQWCPARYGVATPISITGFWLIATIAVPITKPTCPLRLGHGLNFSELGAFFGRAERLRAREGASIASAATPVKTGGIRRQAVQDGCCGRGCRLLLHFSDAICGAGPRYHDKRTLLLVDCPRFHVARRIACRCSINGRIVLRFPATNRPDGQITSDFQKSCQAQELKIFRFRRRANHLYKLAPSRPTEGRIRIVRDAGRDAVDAAASGVTRDGRAGFVRDL